MTTRNRCPPLHIRGSWCTLSQLTNAHTNNPERVLRNLSRQREYWLLGNGQSWWDSHIQLCTSAVSRAGISTTGPSSVYNFVKEERLSLEFHVLHKTYGWSERKRQAIPALSSSTDTRLLQSISVQQHPSSQQDFWAWQASCPSTLGRHMALPGLPDRLASTLLPCLSRRNS